MQKGTLQHIVEYGYHISRHENYKQIRNGLLNIMAKKCEGINIIGRCVCGRCVLEPVQHHLGQNGYQIPVMPMETKQPMNAVATSQCQTSQIPVPRTATSRAMIKCSSEQSIAASTFSEMGPSRSKTSRVIRHNMYSVTHPTMNKQNKFKTFVSAI